MEDNAHESRRLQEEVSRMRLQLQQLRKLGQYAKGRRKVSEEAKEVSDVILRATEEDNKELRDSLTQSQNTVNSLLHENAALLTELKKLQNTVKQTAMATSRSTSPMSPRPVKPRTKTTCTQTDSVLTECPTHIFPDKEVDLTHQQTLICRKLGSQDNQSYKYANKSLQVELKQLYSLLRIAQDDLNNKATLIHALEQENKSLSSSVAKLANQLHSYSLTGIKASYPFNTVAVSKPFSQLTPADAAKIAETALSMIGSSPRKSFAEEAQRCPQTTGKHSLYANLIAGVPTSLPSVDSSPPPSPPAYPYTSSSTGPAFSWSWSTFGQPPPPPPEESRSGTVQDSFSTSASEAARLAVAAVEAFAQQPLTKSARPTSTTHLSFPSPSRCSPSQAHNSRASSPFNHSVTSSPRTSTSTIQTTSKLSSPLGSSAPQRASSSPFRRHSGSTHPDVHPTLNNLSRSRTNSVRSDRSTSSDASSYNVVCGSAAGVVRPPSLGSSPLSSVATSPSCQGAGTPIEVHIEEE